jgi:xylan 1,4-beta-xylosidase
MGVIQNPVLRGFNPDPSIMRVGDDYYIATSTFEWFPGVCIHHSRDLRHWRLASRPLDRPGLLDMRGNPNSGGVWAPCLSWSEGLFHLVYTDMKRWAGQVKDCHNYLTTAPSVEGPWSDPVHLNSSGFDASLFHDPGGRKWLLNMLWDFRSSQSGFGGILLQEYCPEKRRLLGEPSMIFRGTELGLVEGPHLYTREGFYYLVTAEGGTFATHAVSVARSTALAGPYEVMPGNPLLTSAHDPDLALQSAGHGSLVETQSGEWVMAYLCRRPRVKGRSVLGRETCLQSVEWDQDGWPRLKHGGRSPVLTCDVPDLPGREWEQDPPLDDFQGPVLRACYHSLRVPLDDSLMSLTERPGFLRLKGRESILSNFRQALVARRIAAFKVAAATCVEFEPSSFQQLAGLAAFYSTESFYYLYISRAAHASKCLGIMRCERGGLSFPVEKEYPVEGWNRVFLGFDLDRERLSFRYSQDGKTWNPIGWEMDSSILSDEHAIPCGFTGAFVALCCQDLSGRGLHADFDFLSYVEIDA